MDCWRLGVMAKALMHDMTMRRKVRIRSATWKRYMSALIGEIRGPRANRIVRNRFHGWGARGKDIKEVLDRRVLVSCAWWVRRWDAAVEGVMRLAEERGAVAWVLSQQFAVVGIVGLPSLLAHEREYERRSRLELSWVEMEFLAGG